MFIFRKARSPTKTLNDLDAYLSGLDDEPIKWLAREVSSWGNEFSYAELEAVIQSGQLDALIDWQGRYSKVVNETFAPIWTAAMVAAAAKATRGMTVLSDSDWYVQSWINNRGGELISQLSDESRRAIMNIILRGQELHMAPRDVAKQIRPLIGLNARQAEANVNYRDKVYQQFRDNGLSHTTAAARADKAAIKYAGKQHRYRAETIVLTENAFAYNRGAHMGVSQSIANGYMGRCEMVWTTAGTNRVCSRCLALKDTVVGHTDESGVQLPPLHPRCRCAIMYREVGEPSISGRSFRPLTPERIKEIKESEDIAYNAKTNADFNFQRRTSVANWANEIRFANGDGKGLERMINCQRCVVAHEARMRGYDVIARPSWGREDPLQRVGNWLEVFEKDGREIYNCVGSNAAEIEKFINNKMNEWGKNSRAFVWFDWEKPVVYLGKGHVIVAQLNENGFLQFGDPQAKKIGAVRCLNSAKVGSVIIMRVDNLKFTDIVKRCCKNKGTTI